MATLQQTWDQSCIDFDNTFQVPDNTQGASEFGLKYYAGGITVTKPSGATLYGVGAVLADFVATCPYFTPTHITTMDEQWGKVIGEGTFSDNDNPEHAIHFVFTWVKDSFGNWTVTHVSANNKPAPAPMRKKRKPAPAEMVVRRKRRKKNPRAELAP
jgi:hypothetical protein